MTGPAPLTVGQLAELVGVTPGTIRHHCRRGLLAGLALRHGREWSIPFGVAEDFVKGYDRYCTLRRGLGVARA